MRRKPRQGQRRRRERLFPAPGHQRRLRQSPRRKRSRLRFFPLRRQPQLAQSFGDPFGHLGGRAARGIEVAVTGEDALLGEITRIPKTDQHDPCLVGLEDQQADPAPFQAAPALARVIGAEHHNDQLALVAVEARQVNIEIGPCQFGLVEFDEEHLPLAELRREALRHRSHRGSLLAGVGEAHQEATASGGGTGNGRLDAGGKPGGSSLPGAQPTAELAPGLRVLLKRCALAEQQPQHPASRQLPGGKAEGGRRGEHWMGFRGLGSFPCR
jgi:hypothetical protein